MNNYNDSYSEQYRKVIGIYFDGNINHLPDYLISSPAYNNFIENKIISNKKFQMILQIKSFPRQRES